MITIIPFNDTHYKIDNLPENKFGIKYSIVPASKIDKFVNTLLTDFEEALVIPFNQEQLDAALSTNKSSEKE